MRRHGIFWIAPEHPARKRDSGMGEAVVKHVLDLFLRQHPTDLQREHKLCEQSYMPNADMLFLSVIWSPFVHSRSRPRWLLAISWPGR